MKQTLSLLLAFLLLLCAVSCGQDMSTAAPRDFSVEGMTITLNKAFDQVELEGYTAGFATSTVAVFVLKEGFDKVEHLESLSLSAYAAWVHNNNLLYSPDPLETVEGLTVMEYTFTNNNLGRTDRYFAAMFKGPDAFWLVQFSCALEEYDVCRPMFIEWAKTVTFEGQTETPADDAEEGENNEG